jgi:hypothetical protein
VQKICGTKNVKFKTENFVKRGKNLKNEFCEQKIRQKCGKWGKILLHKKLQ